MFSRNSVLVQWTMGSPGGSVAVVGIGECAASARLGSDSIDEQVQASELAWEVQGPVHSGLQANMETAKRVEDFGHEHNVGVDCDRGKAGVWRGEASPEYSQGVRGADLEQGVVTSGHEMLSHSQPASQTRTAQLSPAAGIRTGLSSQALSPAGARRIAVGEKDTATREELDPAMTCASSARLQEVSSCETGGILETVPSTGELSDISETESEKERKKVKRRQLLEIVGFLVLLALPLGGGLLIARLTMRDADPNDERSWYQHLRNAPWVPPPVVFAIVWPILYILMGFASWIATFRSKFNLSDFLLKEGPYFGGGTPESGTKWTVLQQWQGAIVLYLIQLAVNFSWTPVFFGSHNIAGALAICIVLLVLLLTTTLAFFNLRRVAGILLLPYIGWLLLATSLIVYTYGHN